MALNQRLALLGGAALRSEAWPVSHNIGAEEKEAVLRVLDRGVLSQFLGAWTPDFWGGPEVQALEKEWAAYFAIPHAVAMNSATSCLYAAIGAIGICPGDEVIVSPYTMSASATAPLIYGGIPVFADVDPHTFCITAETIQACLSPRTKAIIVVDIFGRPADYAAIMALAKKEGLYVIEDAAQAPGVLYHHRPSGTLADIGVFSLNYHKIIHCGEGGVAVCANPVLAERLALIRNHAETVLHQKGPSQEQALINMVGFNYRMTEIEAAIARVQLQKLAGLMQKRQQAGYYLNQALAHIPGLHLPTPDPQAAHGYYVYPIRLDLSSWGLPRALIAQALVAEGVPVQCGYVKPLYWQELYQKRVAFGHYPFSLLSAEQANLYALGRCPVTEELHQESCIVGDYCHSGVSEKDLEQIVQAFEKVYQNKEQLIDYSQSRVGIGS